MDNFPANIDGRAKGFKGDLDHVNGAHHARTKSAWFQKKNTAVGGGESRGSGKVRS